MDSCLLYTSGVDMAESVAGEKKGGLTFAPEAGSQRMRDIINKNVTEEDLDRAAKAAFEAGWNRMKLYFMMGLPGERDEDIVAKMCIRDRRSLRCHVGREACRL